MARKHRHVIVTSTLNAMTSRLMHLDDIAQMRNAWIDKSNQSKTQAERETRRWVVAVEEKLDPTLFPTPKLVFKK